MHEPPAEPPLGELLWPLHLRHRDPNDPGRHSGYGYPLIGTSWRNRPSHVGWLIGGLWGDTLVRDAITQDEDLFGGYRLGWDFDHYFGAEARFAFAHLDLTYLNGATSQRTSRVRYYDIHFLYYPWGDSKWRPYATAGLGVADFYFRDATSRGIHQANFEIPYGIGVKYYFRNYFTLRAGLMDNWSIGSGGLETMHNISLDFGVEYRFGGRRTKYRWE